MDKDKDWILSMLNGNINRMCVTNDQEELVSRINHAKRNLDKLYNLRRKEIIKFKESDISGDN